MRFALLISLLVLAGCNTMTGLGQDMQNAGTNLQDSSERHQQKMAYPDDAEPEPY